MCAMMHELLIGCDVWRENSKQGDDQRANNKHSLLSICSTRKIYIQ